MFIMKSVFCFLSTVRRSDLELISYAQKNTRIKKIPCSSCGKTGSLKMHSQYKRDCIHIQNNERMVSKVSIPVLACSCGSHQAVIPDVLIPFGSYSIRFVLKVLHLFAKRKKGCTVLQFCARWGIAVSTLYDWRKLLKSQWNDWIGYCQTVMHLERWITSTPGSIPAFPQAFHSLFNRAFLQSCKRLSCFVTLPFLPSGVPIPDTM